MYNVLGILFLIAEIALIGIIGYLVIFRRATITKSSLGFLVPAFILIYALYLTGSVYADDKIDFYHLFYLINATLATFAFDAKFDVMEEITAKYSLFNAAFTVGCILAFVTIVFGVIVLFGNRIFNVWRQKVIFHRGGDIVLGYSPDSVEYLKRNKNTVLWAEDLDAQTYGELIREGYAVCRAPLNAKNVTKRLKSAEHHMIAFRDTAYAYSEIVSFFEELKRGKNRLLYLHLESSAHEIRIVREKYFDGIQEEANSFLTSFCKYELIARRFVSEYPISKFIPRDFFNDNLTLKEDKKINVVFLGFGKVNFELFKLFATQFQFAKETDGGKKLCTAPVNYYVFDNNKNRLQNEYFVKLLHEYDELFASSDLPPAEPICNLKEPQELDANSAQVRTLFKSFQKENQYTYFVVSLGEDLNDAAYARSIKALLGDRENYKIFVRAKNADNRIFNRNETKIVYFGENVDCYTHEAIVNDDLMKISQNINDLYNKLSVDPLQNYRAWQKLPVVEQYSNISSALGVYFKLGLLGFELKKTGAGVTQKEYDAVYKSDKSEKTQGFDYFFGTERANVLAFIEHARWNAYYLFVDYKPLRFSEFWWQKKEIENKETGEKKMLRFLQHKDTSRSRHACLTTYLGLQELIAHKYDVISAAHEQGETDVEPADMNELMNVYRYDYMVLDGLYKTVSRLKYQIVPIDTQTKNN